LDLAKAIALFDPQQLTLSLCCDEERKILSALQKGEQLSEEHAIALRFVKTIVTSISQAKVAVALLKNYPTTAFGLNGKFSEQELHAIAKALKNSPSPKMKWENVNDESYPSIMLSWRQILSGIFQLANAAIGEVNGNSIVTQKDAGERLSELTKNHVIAFESTLEEAQERLLKTVVPGRVLKLEKMNVEIDNLFKLNPAAFIPKKTSIKQFRAFEKHGYQPGVITLLEDRSGKRLLSSQRLDQFFKNGSAVQLLPNHSLFTLSQKEWDQKKQQDELDLNFKYTDEITGWNIKHFIYFAPHNALPPVEAFNYLLVE
ncbi:MAG: hypothetical protein JSR80_05135, partial [Verrucomicrobia bacterium]|nr:hypothetical protein [Verrucomicrobiota bacterium]